MGNRNKKNGQDHAADNSQDEMNKGEDPSKQSPVEEGSTTDSDSIPSEQ